MKDIIPKVEEVINIHNKLVLMFSKTADPIAPSGPRDRALIESACARPHASMKGKAQYKNLPEKASALFHSLIKNHPFHNGNKRTALVTLIHCLFENDRIFDKAVTDDQVFDFVLGVASSQFPPENPAITTDDLIAALAHWIRQNTTKMTSTLRDLNSGAFVARCQQAGAVSKSSNSEWIIQGTTGTVRFSKSTSKLNGKVQRKYLKKLGITFSQTGLTTYEVTMGLPSDQEQILRFRTVLNRLADA